ALGITAVDPIKQHLLFERFLSEGRGKAGHPSWPDIDLDLPSGALRESVIQEIYTRYGRSGAAMVANVITYRGRSTAREVGKVLGLPADIVDRFSALYASGDFEHTLGLSQQLVVAGLPLAHPRHEAMVSLCQQLASLPRHLGQHSGGMILCPGRLNQVVPIEPASMPNRTIVQWDKDDCEDLGLVKIDFLGLGMMAVLQDCQRICAERGRPFELRTVPQDDAPTYDLMCNADTIGVFQIESRAQMATLPRLKPREFYDVAISVAIIRPGPITGGLINPLIRRRAGLEPVICLTPEVHEQTLRILGRTYGVILFQEQMLGLAMELAGFSGAEAEELRRALGFHRDKARLLAVTGKLSIALRGRGHSENVVTKVVEACSSFALYGFPESHAISFALLAYASTWLKLNRAAEFYASLLNNQPMGFYSPATLVQDGRRRKPALKFRPVCVQHSDWDCTVEADDAVRLGLRYIHGLRETHAREIVTQRAIRPFASLGDFLRRTNGTGAERRALAAIGALNVLAGHRRSALWQVEAAWSSAESLFQYAGGLLDDADPDTLAPMSVGERMQADFSGSSLTVGVHPMSLVRDQLPDLWRAGDLSLAREGERVIIGGSVICRQRPGTAKGIMFISLEDETGIANAVVASEMFERCRMIINQEPTLRISGRLQNREGVIHIRAEKIDPLLAPGVPVQSSHDFR
ncbi:MAG: OB-fold nucleic acid binding domain-containing protein, partial [Opitutaceae bacterium]